MGRFDAEAVKELQGAVYRGDGSVVEVVRERLTDDVLQLAGDGLLDAVAASVQGARKLAEQCAAALRERGWWGDEELADQLEAALGERATPMLRPLPVNLEELATFLEGDPLNGGAKIDLKTGECWPDSSEFEGFDDSEEDEEGRWLYVESQGSHDGYRDMELFIATVDDPDVADRLKIAISGRGAFRRFKDVLARWPHELERYYMLSNERQRGRARAWLAGKGYRPAGAARR
jgi:Uncharacterised protein family (UPF0158)